MANYWEQTSPCLQTTKTNLATIAQALQQHLDPLKVTRFWENNLCITRQNGTFTISHEVQEFSERHPEVSHYCNHGDVPYMYDHGGLFEQNHIDEYIQNGLYIERTLNPHRC